MKLFISLFVICFLLITIIFMYSCCVISSRCSEIEQKFYNKKS